MAGRPRRAALLERIELRGGWDEAVFSLVRAGDMSITKIAEGLGVSYSLLRDAIRHGGEERKAQYEAAKHESADGCVEQAGEAIRKLDDLVEPSSAQVSRAKLQADHWRWLAVTRDRAQYGDNPLAVVGAADLGQLLLSALQAAGPATLIASPATEDEDIQEADFEMEQDHEDTTEGSDSSDPDDDFGVCEPRIP